MITKLYNKNFIDLSPSPVNTSTGVKFLESILPEEIAFRLGIGSLAQRVRRAERSSKEMRNFIHHEDDCLRPKAYFRPISHETPVRTAQYRYTPRSFSPIPDSEGGVKGFVGRFSAWTSSIPPVVKQVAFLGLLMLSSLYIGSKI